MSIVNYTHFLMNISEHGSCCGFYHFSAAFGFLTIRSRHAMARSDPSRYGRDRSVPVYNAIFSGMELEVRDVTPFIGRVQEDT